MSRIVHLKIKIKSLAAEARIIRAEERKAKAQRRTAVATLACEEATVWFAKAEARLARATETFWSLRHHRTSAVRNEARISQLAYGFLRSTSYSEIEQKTDDPPDFDAVKKMADRFDMLTRSDGPWMLWKEAAEAHLKRSPREYGRHVNTSADP